MHWKEGIYQSSLFCYCTHSFDMSSDCGLCKGGNQITGPTGAQLQPPPAYTNRNKLCLSISNNRTTTFTSRLLRSLSSHLKAACVLFVYLCIRRRAGWHLLIHFPWQLFVKLCVALSARMCHEPFCWSAVDSWANPGMLQLTGSVCVESEASKDRGPQ